MDLHLSRPHILRYWAGTPDQHRQTNRLYRRTRIGAAQRELSRNNGEHFLAPGYACVSRADWLRRYHDTVLPAPIGSVATTTRCFLGSPLSVQGRRWVVVAWKHQREHNRTRYTWFAFWTTRSRLNFLAPRRTTQLRQEPYEALSACNFTSPACFLGGSNVT